jgi:hypothetical protein
MRWWALLMVVLCARIDAADMTIEMGVGRVSIPPSGTWWVDNYPATFSRDTRTFGIGLVGRNWSVSIENLGISRSSSIACPGVALTCPHPIGWYGEQNPRGVWTAWEPHYGSLFGQLGAGVYRPGFSMSIPAYPYDMQGVSRPCSCVWNDRVSLGYEFGGGLRLGRYLDFVITDRYVSARGGDTPGNFIGLGRSVLTSELRIHAIVP